MQRTTPEGIIIACDFTGEDWDGESPMIEGHKGSVLSLRALALAIEGATVWEGDDADADTDTDTGRGGKGLGCTMCRHELEVGLKAWRPADPNMLGEGNPEAAICWDCIQQADLAFSRDKDTAWERKLEPTKRWK